MKHWFLSDIKSVRPAAAGFVAPPRPGYQRRTSDPQHENIQKAIENGHGNHRNS